MPVASDPDPKVEPLWAYHITLEPLKINEFLTSHLTVIGVDINRRLNIKLRM